MPKNSIVVTGATGSMGAAACRALASEGQYRVIMACRNPEKGEKVRESILADYPAAELELRIVDLKSVASVRAFADSLAAEAGSIAGIFNNAGTLNRDFRKTADGFEECVAVNFIAPMIICDTLAPLMKAGSRIVNMVSLTCRFPKIDRQFFDKTAADFSQLGTYALSKLALMIYSIRLSERFPQLFVNVSDPGVVNSNMIHMDRWFDPIADALFRPFCKKPIDGVSPALRALKADCSGRLFVGKSVRNIPARYRRVALADWLFSEAAARLDSARP